MRSFPMRERENLGAAAPEGGRVLAVPPLARAAEWHCLWSLYFHDEKISFLACRLSSAYFVSHGFPVPLLAVMALAVAVLQGEKQRSYENYRSGFAKTKAQIVARLRHPSGQLALLNPTQGGVAPSKYLKLIEEKVSTSALDAYIETHHLDVTSLRNDDFDTFLALRAKTLLDLIGNAMGKHINNRDSTDVVEASGKSLD
jgi:hypothetical protein